MRTRAHNTSLDWAEAAVAAEYRRRLAGFARQKPRITFVNDIDDGSPPLRVTLIDEYVYGDSVSPPDEDTIIGCSKPCRPNMAHECGCEYGRVCTCLEFAEVDQASLLDSDLEKWRQTNKGTEGDTMGLPKRFPYKLDGTMQAAALASKTRYMVYECNSKCHCGPNCKTKITQRGRKYPLEIFKTESRGWGLRSTQDLRKGDFVDMYFGKVITEKDAETRDQAYLFSLDKFKDQIPEDDILTVDGSEMGGVSRFINHSCEPNCAIYTISYNKHDVLRYNLAFFAQDHIPKGEEFTFDYNGQTQQEIEYNPDLFESSQKATKSRMKCYCGAPSCRGYLFF